MSSYSSPQTVLAAADSPALQAIDPSQAKMDTSPAAQSSAPPSPNPLGRVNGAPVSGNRQPPMLQSPYPVPQGYPYPPAGYPPPGYQYPPGYGYPPPQGYAPTYGQPGYAAPYPTGYPPQYAQPYGTPQQPYAQPYVQPSYAPQGYPPAYAQPPAGYQPQGAYPPAGYPPANQYSAPPSMQPGYPPQQTAYPPANRIAPTATRPPAGYPNENLIPDFNKALPAAPPRAPGSQPMPPGGQGWATNVPTGPQSSPDEDRVMKLEQAAFGSTYPEHEVEDRVDHLEKEVFGSKTDAPMADRIAKLETKLGGAGAFGHTNTPIPQGSARGSHSGAGGFQSSAPNRNKHAASQSTPIGNSPQQPTSEPLQLARDQESASQPTSDPLQLKRGPDLTAQGSNSLQLGQALTQPQSSEPESPSASTIGQSDAPQGPFPTAQPVDAPMTAVAQSLDAPNPLPSTQRSPLAARLPVRTPPPPIPLPKAPPVVVPKHVKEKPRSLAQAPPRGATNSPEVQGVVDTIPYDSKAGDYFSAIKKFDNDTVARWTSFPVTIKLPPESPESWKKNLQVGIAEWNRFIPVQAVDNSASTDIEVNWVNHLLPGVLGITRLTTPKKGNIHVEIFLLRPTFYVQDIPEHVVQVAFLHELGHAIGIFGHSSAPDDLMCTAELSPAMKGKSSAKSLSVEPRDLNTLKRVYDAPALPGSFLLPQPIEWSFQ